MIIFPILVEDCLWNIVNWIKDIQIYPKDTKPLNEFSENEQKKKLKDIVASISNILTRNS